MGVEGQSQGSEFVDITGWPSVEKHKQFAEHESFAEYREPLGFATGLEVWRYRRIL